MDDLLAKTVISGSTTSPACPADAVFPLVRIVTIVTLVFDISPRKRNPKPALVPGAVCPRGRSGVLPGAITLTNLQETSPCQSPRRRGAALPSRRALRPPRKVRAPP